MPILISGSLAYDYIMDFPDSFKNHILADQIHILNVGFAVDKLKKNLGGTAGNIAYTMKLLGGEPVILAALGTDAEEYISFFKKHGIKNDYIKLSKELFSSSAHITTDKDDNQITAFYSGAGEEAINSSVGDVKEQIDLAILAPARKDVTIKHSKECHERRIPIVFDPGQQATSFSPQELSMLIGQATFLIANDYEMRLVQEKTGWDAKEMFNHVEVLITTLGEKGSIISTGKETFEIEPCRALSIDDPTGAGDAYRSGFFTAFAKGKDLQTCGRVASVSAVYAVEHYGTQNHFFTLSEFKERYKEAYGEEIEL